MPNEAIKSAIEIGTLAGQLTPSNQTYVLNTINALLYSQQTNQQTERPSSADKNTQQAS